MTPQPGTAGTDDDPLDSIETEQLVVDGQTIASLVGLAFDSANASDGVLRFDGSGSTNGITDGSAKVLVNGTVYDVAGGEWVDQSGTSHTLDSWEKVVNSQFDVTITGTNGPVAPGSTLDVTVDVTNNGTDQDTQTITLDIDNGVGQVDSASASLSGGGSTTTTLSWSVPSGQTEQDYQATVSSADDTASQTVAVGSVIPDSVVVQQFATTWSQGDATWQDGATDDGAQDVAVNGDPQASTLSDGAESISSDGSDDYGELTLPSQFEGSGLQEFSVEFTMQSSSAGGGVILGARNSDETQFFEVNKDIPSDGNFRVRFSDEVGDGPSFYASTNPSINDGQRHDISVIVNDAFQNDFELIIDGATVGITFATSTQPSSFTTWDTPMAIWARNLGGSIGSYYQEEMGAMRWHDSAINNQTINTYP